MRLQWCREHIDEVQEACGLSNSTAMEVKQAARFCVEHSDFSELPTKPIIALIRVKDEQVRERAILSVKNTLNQTNATGGKWKTTFTEKEVKKIIEKVELELRKEAIAEIKAEREVSPILEVIEDVVEPEPEEPLKNSVGDIIYSDAQVEKIKDEASLGLVINIITRYEIDLYFDIMKKIMCDEDIPKHKKRVDMMIANKTLILVA